MKVLLTGGAGYIGAHTCVELLNAGYEIAVADNYSNSSETALLRVQELTGKEFPYYEANVADQSAMRVIFAREKPDGVIHFAGFKAVGESVEKPLEYYRNNLDTTLTLLETMRSFNTKQFVFSSSAKVYSVNAEASMMDEGMPTGCTNPYGWTKYMIEQILRDAANADPELSVMLLRYFNPVGAHESGRIGEDPNGLPNNLMPRVLKNALGQIPVLGVFGDDYPTPDGTCIRDYIHVVDLAKGHVAAIRYLQGKTGCDAVNLGTGIGYSVFDILHTFERVNNIRLRYEVQPRRPGDAAACCANPRKAKELLGWQAEKNLEDMCRDAWRWQQLNPNGYSGT